LVAGRRRAAARVEAVDLFVAVVVDPVVAILGALFEHAAFAVDQGISYRVEDTTFREIASAPPEENQ